MPFPSPDDPTKMKAFKYTTPSADVPKAFVWLARTQWMTCAIQKVGKGGETNLHSHPHMDGFWYVLKGRAKFYSDHTEVFAELGPNEGVLIPRGVKYWFERTGDEPLEILQVECSDVKIQTDKQLMEDRVNFAPQARVVNNSVYEEAKDVVRVK